MKASLAGNVFITGANGFIGANLTRHFVKKNYNVILLVRKNSNSWRIKDIFPKTTAHIGDLSNLTDLEKIFDKHKPEYIIHAASYGNYPNQNNIRKMIDTNIIGFNNLLTASSRLSYKAFISLGTSSEYGHKNKPMSEEDILNPESFYASTKASATLHAQVFAKKYNKPIYILRLFSVFGPFEEKSRLIPTVINAALKNNKIQLTSSTSRHDFLYINDLIYAIEKIINSKKNNLKNGEIINIGAGIQHTNEEIVKEIEKIMRIKFKVNRKFPKRDWDTNYWVADIKKAHKLLKWKPKYSFTQGLKETIDWTKNLNEED